MAVRFLPLFLFAHFLFAGCPPGRAKAEGFSDGNVQSCKPPKNSPDCPSDKATLRWDSVACRYVCEGGNQSQKQTGPDKGTPGTGTDTTTGNASQGNGKNVTNTQIETSVDTGSSIGMASFSFYSEPPTSQAQGVSFCNSAAVHAMGGLLQLEEGNAGKGSEEFSSMKQSIKRASLLNNACIPDSEAEKFLSTGIPGSISNKLEGQLGVTKHDVLDYVHDAAKKIFSTSPRGIGALIGKVPNEETKQRMLTSLANDSSSSENVAAADAESKAEESSISSVTESTPSAPTPIPEFETSAPPRDLASAKASPTAPTKFASVSYTLDIEDMTRLDAALRANKLSDPSSVDIEASLFTRIRRCTKQFQKLNLNNQPLF